MFAIFATTIFILSLAIVMLAKSSPPARDDSFLEHHARKLQEHERRLNEHRDFLAECRADLGH